jgi:hypothetical protein
VRVEQRLRREHLPVLAVAALRDLLVDPRLLDGMERAVGRKPFERRDLDALHRGNGPDAGAHRLALDEHGARPALAQSAPEVRPVQVEVVAQHVQERRRGIDVQGVRLAVHPQSDGHHGRSVARQAAGIKTHVTLFVSAAACLPLESRCVHASLKTRRLRRTSRWFVGRTPI